ncbi:MAG: hypothetical protein ACE15E_11850 [Acidobacteriota bacterium]
MRHAGLDWDLWLGPAAYRPYHPDYHPRKWRAWLDFGTGAGMMADSCLPAPASLLVAATLRTKN